MKIAVVILNWNGQALLEKFLPSIISNSANPKVDIYVADNASTDNSIAFLKTNFPEVKIIELDKNYGYAGGYNRSLRGINSDIYILLNSDVEVSNNWLQGITKRFESDSNIAAIQPKILSYRNKDLFEYAGAAGGYIDKWGYSFCKGRIFDHIEKDQQQYDTAEEIFWASGACLCIRSEIYNEVGGLDEDFFAHMEEIDLCWRTKNKGYSIWYEPTSVVYHIGGATLSQEKWQKTYLNFRNNLFLILKNDYSKWFWLKFVFRLTLDGISAVKFIFDLNPKHSYAVFKSHVSMYFMLPKSISKRNQLKRQVYNPNRNGILNESVVWKYFIKKIKTFDEIF